jgi:subtilisin-like proprotein convertase family protein
MASKNSKKSKIIFVCFFLFWGVFVFSMKEKGGLSELDFLCFQSPQLRTAETNLMSQSLENLPLEQQEAGSRFISRYGKEWNIWFDLRRGRPSLIDGGAIPFIPGYANSLRYEDFGPGCKDNFSLPLSKVEELARDFLREWRELFKVDPEELALDPLGSGPVGESYYLLRFQWAPSGIPVEESSVYFRINGGNLLQVATREIGNIRLDTTPYLSAETAWQILSGYVGGLTVNDKILESGRLVIVPITPRGEDSNLFNGRFGEMIDYRLCYKLVFEREGVIGRWESLVDAHTGELLLLRDANVYGSVRGTLYLEDALSGATNIPLPFAKTSLEAPKNYSDAAGRFVGDSATVNLDSGRFIKMRDICGNTNLATSTGIADYGTSQGDDCGVPNPNPAGDGNTWATKTLYYHLTTANRKSAAYLPSNDWLQNRPMIVNSNQNSWCNASANDQELNFFKKAGGCSNLGEIPGVGLHEWGHGLDFNDGSGGLAPPCEAVADWIAALQLRDSCPGKDLAIFGTCGGYGDACTECRGIRELDYMKHSSLTPWTAQNHNSIWFCGAGGYNGPCGWEDHCESGIASQALWDFVNRDLPADCGITGDDAWQLAERLFISSMPTMGNMYTCVVGSPTTTDGCGGDSLYTVLRFIDDSGDGTANGTPHSKAIYHALARHNIACGLENSPQNQNQTTCVPLSAPVLSCYAQSNDRVYLSWTSGGAGTTWYYVLKSDLGPDRGFTRIATVLASQTEYMDPYATNGITSNYQVQPVAGIDSCAGPLSNVLSITPSSVPCSGEIILDTEKFACSQTVTVTIRDNSVALPMTVTAWSSTDSTQVPVSMTENPVGSGIYKGSFQTSATAGSGKVRVSNGDILTVRYFDADACGHPNVTKFMVSAVDCEGPAISNVRASNITGHSAVILWDTDEYANSFVQYSPPASSVNDPVNYTAEHAVVIEGLQPCTEYTYEVSSADSLGNITYENNGGASFTFTTTPEFTPVLTRTANQSIPDNNTTGVWTALSVYDGRFIQDLDIEVVIEHPRVSDLKLYIRDSQGTEVPLSINRGGSGENFTGTIFDDEAGTAIYNGTAPFTGRYKPEWPLSVFDGRHANGNWILTVIDDVPGVTGTVLEWSLRPTYSEYSCGTELNFASASAAAETCTGTGGGKDDGIIDAGEEVTLQISLLNNGSTSVNQVSGHLTSNSPFVTILDADSSFTDILPSQTGTSNAPHFKIKVSPDATCGSSLEMSLHVNCWENPEGWDEDFSLTVGDAVFSSTPLVDFWEPFAYVNGIPTGWKKEVIHSPGMTIINEICAELGYMIFHIGYESSDSWFHTYAINLEPGFQYTLQFLQKADILDKEVGADLSFWLGTAQNSSSMTQRIWGETNLSENICQQRSVEFTVPSAGTYYLGIHHKSAQNGSAMLWVDDILISHEGLASCSMNPCTPCEDPGAPVITAVTDPYPCEAGSLRVWFTEGSGASQHDLYMDGTLVMYGIPSSPAFIAPGDDDPHEFVIRAINGQCHTDSAPMTGSDEDGPAPGIPTPAASDLDECDPTGIEISWPPVSEATSYDVRIDGTSVVGNVLSPYIYNPGNSYSHTFNVRAKNGNCAGSWSSNITNADLSLRPAAPAAPVVADPDYCALTGVQVSWVAVPDATSYDLMIDGTTVINSVSSPHVYQPGNSSSHNYQVRALRSSCKGNFSVATAGTDRITLETPAPPLVADLDSCAQSGVSISWSPVPGATGYDLVVDGSELFTSVTSPYIHDPKDTAVHAYSIMPKSPSCNGDRSDNTEWADVNNGVAVPSSFGGGDDDPCNPTGIRLTWNAVSGATGYDLMVDSSIITGVSSPYIYVPGDSESHVFSVRAKKASCVSNWTASLEEKDSAEGPPVPGKAPGASDLNPCALTGIRVYFDPLPDATYHDIMVDGKTVHPDIGTDKIIEVGDSLTHTFQYRGRTAVCTGLWSPAKSASDLNDTPGVPAITSVEDINPSLPNGVRVNFNAGSGAERHDLYMDGALVVTFYASGDPFIPGDALSHDFQVRAIKGDCYSLSTIVQGSDQPPVKPGEVAPGLTPETAQSWIGTTTHTWPADSSCTSGYLLYRGTQADLPYLLDGSEDSCVAFRGYNSGENTKTNLTEDPSVVPGRFFWYLVTGLNASGEGTAGFGSGGERVVDNSGDCQ